MTLVAEVSICPAEEVDEIQVEDDSGDGGDAGLGRCGERHRLVCNHIFAAMQWTM